MDVIRTFAAAVIITLVVQPSADCQPSRDVGARRLEVRAHIEDGRYAEAESEGRALLASFGALSHENRIELNRAADLLVEALARNGRGAEADTRAFAEEMVRRREAAGEEDTPALATALRNLGDVLLQAGFYREAVAALERAQRSRQTAGAAGSLDAAIDLDYLTLAFLPVGRYDEALDVSGRALALKQKILAPTDVGIARTLEIRGRVWQRKGDYAHARSDLEPALAIREAAAPRHPDMATTLMLLGIQLSLEGEITKSREFLERGLSLAETTLRPEHPDVASLLRMLAKSVKDLGDLIRARALLERAVSIAETSLGAGHPLLADCLNDLAGSLLIQGEYVAARPLYERALTTYEQRLGPDNLAGATVLYNLAILHTSLGDFSRARALHQRAVTSWQRVLGPVHPIVARASSELGQTFAEQGLHREARQLFERALAIRERTLGSDHTSVAETLSSLANSLAQLGQRQRALELSRRAMAIWEKSKAPETAAGFPESLLVHAAVLLANGDLAGALGAYERAQQIRVPLLGESHPSVAQVNASLAAVRAQAGQPQEALMLALDAEQVGRRHLRLMIGSLPERQGLNYAVKRPEGLTLALSLAGGTERQASVLDALIRGRSLVLDEIASRHRALADEGASSVAPLWTALTSARQRLANLTIQGPGRRPGQYAGLLEEAQREKEEAERALAEQSAAFRAQRLRGDIGLDQVRAHLPASSALVSFVRYDRRIFIQSARPTTTDKSTGLSRSPRIVPSYLAFVLRSDGSVPVVVPLAPAATIDALVASWRQEMIADITRPAGAPRSDPSFHSLGVSLRRKIWDPVAADLGDAQRIFIVPDGTLNLVPLAALPIERGRYLLESGRVIHYLSAERDLVTDESSLVATGSGLLAVGGPAFDDASSFRTALESKTTIGTSFRQADATSRTVSSQARRTESLLSQATPFRGTPSNCVSFRTMRFQALPASRTEADSVTRLWQQFGVEVALNSQAAQALTGTNATELALKRSGPGRRVLHIATHGFFLGDQCAPAVGGTRAVGGLVSSGSKTTPGPTGARATPGRVSLPENPLLLSGLALAGANRRAAAGPDEDDGILTAEEVASLNLKSVEWAVLSACDTGLGTVAAGEGVLGLRRAFQIAGARTVIMSLWSVDDRAARQWMDGLYRARLVQGLDSANAMREASVNFIRDRRAKGQSTHPFYWASFVAAGDWR
jgi:CHAT domain-containing protein/tetratricopeptide (TPR) repeat protein